MAKFLRPSFFYSSAKNFCSALQGPVVGIDLGFTNSSVSIVKNGKPMLITDDEGSRFTPSVVAFTKREVLVGAPAVEQSFLNSQNTIFGIKQLIGRKFDDSEVQKFRKTVPYKIVNSHGDAWVEAQGQLYSPSQIGAFILMKMKKTAENYLKTSATNAVLTVPANFNDSQRQATEEAGQLAGLRVLRVLDEPIAAAMAFDFPVFERKIVAIFDIGGANFNFSILEIEKGFFTIMSRSGSSFGGADFDNVIAHHIVSEFRQKNKFDLTKDLVAMQLIREAAEKAKCELSIADKIDINLHIPLNNIHTHVKLSRSKFEQLSADMIKGIIKPCESAMYDAKVKPFNIYAVVLVGGMARAPMVINLVKKVFGKEPNNLVSSDAAVALGAAFMGNLIQVYNAWKFLELSNAYLFTASELNLAVGGEMLWGACANTVKSFFVNFDILLLSHRSVRAFVVFSALHLQLDKKLSIAFTQAER
uniref:Heat shock 70 kDa protein 14 n=1 Tax=Meloidogyne hapla TaxID=6305 RepID=A0A1I8B0G5_MELHA